MALSNWDCLAYTLNGPSRTGRVTNAKGQTVEIYKNWLNVSEARTMVRGRWPRREKQSVERHRARVTEGELYAADWSITARRGPQNGIYVICHSAAWDLDASDYGDKAILVGCGVSGYTNPEEDYIADAIDLGVDPDTLMMSSTLDDDGIDQRSIVGFRVGDDGSEGFVTVADEGVPDPEWVGVLPESVSFLKAMVADFLREASALATWPSQELGEISWDEALRFNQGDLFFDRHLEGVPDTSSAPGEADDPLIMKALRGG